MKKIITSLLIVLLVATYATTASAAEYVCPSCDTFFTSQTKWEKHIVKCSDKNIADDVFWGDKQEQEEPTVVEPTVEETTTEEIITEEPTTEEITTEEPVIEETTIEETTVIPETPEEEPVETPTEIPTEPSTEETTEVTTEEPTTNVDVTEKISIPKPDIDALEIIDNALDLLIEIEQEVSEIPEIEIPEIELPVITLSAVTTDTVTTEPEIKETETTSELPEDVFHGDKETPEIPHTGFEAGSSIAALATLCSSLFAIAKLRKKENA